MANEPLPDSQALSEGLGPPERLALRPAEAAKALGIGERLLWQETNRGAIPHLRIGGKAIVYPIEALREWLAVNAAKAARR